MRTGRSVCFPCPSRNCGVSRREQKNLPGYLGFFQFLRPLSATAFEQAEMIPYAALDPSYGEQGQTGRICEVFRPL